MSTSKDYWYSKQHKYPHQILVPHMSDEDIDPRRAQELIGWEHHFLRVPINGVAHWGFKTQYALDLFKQIALLPKVQS